MSDLTFRDQAGRSHFRAGVVDVATGVAVGGRWAPTRREEAGEVEGVVQHDPRMEAEIESVYLSGDGWEERVAELLSTYRGPLSSVHHEDMTLAEELLVDGSAEIFSLLARNGQIDLQDRRTWNLIFGSINFEVQMAALSHPDCPRDIWEIYVDEPVEAVLQHALSNPRHATTEWLLSRVEDLVRMADGKDATRSDELTRAEVELFANQLVRNFVACSPHVEDVDQLLEVVRRTTALGRDSKMFLLEKAALLGLVMGDRGHMLKHEHVFDTFLEAEPDNDTLNPIWDALPLDDEQVTLMLWRARGWLPDEARAVLRAKPEMVVPRLREDASPFARIALAVQVVDWCIPRRDSVKGIALSAEVGS